MASKRYPSISKKATWLKGVSYLEKKDRVLRRLIAKTGRLDVLSESKKYLEEDHYASLVKSIIYQQISTSAGRSIIRKLTEEFGGRLPAPAEFLRANPNKVKKSGVSPQKYSYLKDLCQRIMDGRLELKRFVRMDDEDIINELDLVRGIGRWTAEMYLIGTLRRTDVLPADDLGLKKAVQKAYSLDSLPDKKKLLAIAEKWRPYRTIATIYMWRSLD